MSVLRLVVAILGFVLVAPAASARGLEGADVWNSAEIDWKDFPSGVREATATGKPVLMLFQATWCTACKKYRSVFKDRDVVDAARSFVMILVDIDQAPEINGGFSPDGVYVPRTIFLDASGEIRSDLKGSDPKFPHSLDVNGPGELLSLMRRASGGGDIRPDPSRRAAN